MSTKAKVLSILGIVVLIGGFLTLKLVFNEDKQNQWSRSFTNAFGLNEGCLEIRDNGKVSVRFFKVEKLSTAKGTSDGGVRPYRFGRGIIDRNLDNVLSPSEESEGLKYFELSTFEKYLYYDASVKSVK